MIPEVRGKEEDEMNATAILNARSASCGENTTSAVPGEVPHDDICPFRTYVT
jgi:hypothetical protein